MDKENIKITNFNGNISYTKGGKFHRVDGPAAEYINGSKYWYLNGKLHREDGAAVEYANGDKRCYLNNKQYSEEEYKHLVKMLSFI